MANNIRTSGKKRKPCPPKEPEDWCFECKDGGEVIVCDYRNCSKVYHSDCVPVKPENGKSWICAWHYCFVCKESSKFYCLGCVNAVCKTCIASSEFTIIRGDKGLCCDCAELVKIIETNLECDSEGKKISVDGRDTYEGLFKEYWEIIKLDEGLTSDDFFSAQTNKTKMVKNSSLQSEVIEVDKEKLNDSMTSDDDDVLMYKHNSTKRKKSNSLKQNDSMSFDDDDVLMYKHNSTKRKKSNSLKQNDSMSSDDDDVLMYKHNSTKRKKSNSLKQNDSMSSDDDDVLMYKHNSTKRKKSNSLEFMGWGSKPLLSFLASIGKFSTEPLPQWGVRTLVCEYIEKNNLYLAQDKKKFLLDEKLFPIFKKKVMSKNQIYPLLDRHYAETLGDRDREENNDEIISTPPDNCVNDQTSCRKRRLSSLKGKLQLEKEDLFTKASCFAPISARNIKLIYLRQSLVLELSKQPESFMGKVVGAFVRVKMDSSDCKHTRSYHLVRVTGVVSDNLLKRALLQVSFMSKAVPVSELSDNDFTEQECEDLRQKVKANLLQKLTVVELQEKAKSLHEDITKHWIATRLIDLQNQIDRANLRGRQREKFALLDAREDLQQPWRQEQMLKRVPSVSTEFTHNDPEEDY